MIGDRGEGPVLIVGGSEPLGAALVRGFVADGWVAERPTPTAGAAAESSDARLQPYWTAPTPPAAIVVVVDFRGPVVDATAEVAGWVRRLAPRGNAVLVREFAAKADYLERLAEGALIAMTAELARGAAPGRRVNAVYGAPVAPEPERVPRRRAGTADDLAAAAAFLAGRSSGFITGVTLRLDGGAGLRWALSGA